MATVTSTVTIDANGTSSHEWDYVDAFGISHMIKNAETFSLTIDDGGASAVRYAILATTSAGSSMDTYDKESVRFRSECVTQTDGLTLRNSKDLADATTAYTSATLGNWVIPMSCSASADIVQYWKVTALTIGDVDAGAATTITVLKMEDQFGRTMSLPTTGVGITVGQAA